MPYTLRPPAVREHYSTAARAWNKGPRLPNAPRAPHAATVPAPARRTARSVWDAASWQLRATLWGHMGPVYAVAVTPAGDLGLSAGHDRKLRCVSPCTGWAGAGGGGGGGGPGKQEQARSAPSLPAPCDWRASSLESTPCTWKVASRTWDVACQSATCTFPALLAIQRAKLRPPHIRNCLPAMCPAYLLPGHAQGVGPGGLRAGPRAHRPQGHHLLRGSGPRRRVRDGLHGQERQARGGVQRQGGSEGQALALQRSSSVLLPCLAPVHCLSLHAGRGAAPAP